MEIIGLENEKRFMGFVFVEYLEVRVWICILQKQI